MAASWFQATEFFFFLSFFLSFFSSFFKTQVLSMIRIKAYKAKNKDFKPQVSMPYLTLK
jgi:hypothetical protein